MVEFWTAIPMSVRLCLLFVLGVCVGSLANRCIYQWSITQAPLSPWMRRHSKASARQWADYLPIFGWWNLRRESKLFGGWFWIRPLAIEIAMGLVFAALYQWEIQGGQYPSLLPDAQRLFIAGAHGNALHFRFLAHLLLVTLMTIATFIDFDERIIPDQVTVFGALAALAFAVFLPTTRLPIFPKGAWSLLTVTSPNLWPAWLHTQQGLWCGLGCYVGWCLAIWPKIWDTRFGYIKAVQFMWATMIGAPRKNQRPDTPPRGGRGVLAFMLTISILGAAGVVGGWMWGGDHWTSMLTALIGLAFGGGMIWAVRIVGGAALQAEAMGFGDVTLMAMIGAFLGWQPALLIFFFAPFTSLIIAVAQKIFTGESHIAFGPYLCAATVIIMLWWGDLWNGWADGIFLLGWFIPKMLAALLMLMGGMLMGLRFMRESRGENE